MHRNEILALQATFYPLDNTSPTACAWKSSDTKVATVNANGKVTAVQKGSAIITVSCNGFTATTAITVDAPILGVSIDPAPATVHRGESAALRAVIDPIDTTGDTSCTWESSDPKIATVDDKGKVTAMQKGKATITVTCGKFKGKSEITVDVPVSGISLTPPTGLVHRGDTAVLTPVAAPADTTDTVIYTWSSSDTKVASVDNKGNVTAVQKGKTTITARYKGFAAVSNISVDAPMKGITLTPTSATVHRNENLELHAVIYPVDTTDPTAYTWKSSDPAIATVDDKGNVTALQKGKTTITARYKGFAAVSNISVDAPMKGITLTPTSATVHRNESLALQAILDPVDTTDPTAYTWKSSDTKIATVDANGKVTAVQKGKATITVTCGKFKGKSEITVDAPILSVSIDPATLTLYKGDVGDLVAAIAPLDATETPTYEWNSGNTSVARVDAAGHVTALLKGSTEITVKTLHGFAAACRLTVKDVYSIVLSSDGHAEVTASSASVREGSEATLTAVPDANYKLVGWKNLATGTIVSTALTYTFTPTSGMFIQAVTAPLVVNVGDIYENFGGYDWTVVNKDADGNLTLMCKENVGTETWGIQHPIDISYISKYVSGGGAVYEPYYSTCTVYNSWAQSHVRSWLNRSGDTGTSCCNDAEGPGNRPGFLRTFSKEETNQLIPVSGGRRLCTIALCRGNHKSGAAPLILPLLPTWCGCRLSLRYTAATPKALTATHTG